MHSPPSSASPHRPGVSRLEWEALALALIIAHAFYARSLVYPSSFDAMQYRLVANDIANVGLFAKFQFADLRSYAYPLFLLALRRVANTLDVPWALVAFEVQLALHVAAAAALRSAIALASPRLARIAFITVVLNPLALLYTTDTLTESLSTTLIMLAAACWARLFVRPAISWSAWALGSLAVGFAIVVRPGNIYLLAPWVVGAFVLASLHRRTIRQRAISALVVVAFLAMPLIPQLVNNVRNFGAWTPLITYNLGKLQHYAGVVNLKYATALAPVAENRIFYRNPLVGDQVIEREHAREWYFEHPLKGLATMAFHLFGMLDQDLLFTYARDLDPWYRRPLGVLTHGAVAFSVLALGVLVYRARRDRIARAIAATLAAFVIAHLALHATAAVEMRFALPLLVLAGPLAGWQLMTCWPGASLRRRALLVLWGIAWVSSSLALSDWMRGHSPQITAWQAGARSPVQ